VGGRVLVHCHAGCDQGQVIGSLKALGLWGGGESEIPVDRNPRFNSMGDQVWDDSKRREAAVAIWQSATQARGTLIEPYFASRGLQLPPPSCLRFHPALKHPAGGTWPAMIALVTRGSDSAPLAIHRTFLAEDGSGKAPIRPSKMMLGPCRGGVVRLATPSEVLMVGEGIETCLAALQATGLATWAALSTSGLRTLQLPPEVQELIVLADGDEPGEAAARECAWRFKQEGRRARIARPPEGLDFNDLLLGCIPMAMGSTA
jgi:hypothetical protein